MYDAGRYPKDADEITDIFYGNFMKHYSNNRAPLLLAAHSAWYRLSPTHEVAVQAFMDRVLSLGDVYFVTGEAGPELDALAETLVALEGVQTVAV